MSLWKRCTTGSVFACILLIGADSPNVSAKEKAKGKPSRVRQTAAQKGPKIKAFMRKKLVAADQILEGLTNPDMTLVSKGATSMIHMNKEAMWTNFKSPAYTQDSADFVRTAERLVKLAKANDIEGASHTYAQLTIQCVRCHQRVRNRGIARSRTTSQTTNLLAALPSAGQ